MFRLISLLLLSVGMSVAGEIRLALDAVGDYALRHNPQLAAVRLRIEEARGRWQQSGRLSNPELEFEFERKTRGPEGALGISLTQRFPITARLRFEKAFSRAELAAAEAEVHDEERKLVAEVRAAAVKFVAFSSHRELHLRQLAASRNQGTFLRQRVATGEVSPIDLGQVELESQQIEVENLQLSADEAVLLGELRHLLGASKHDRISIVGELPAPKSLRADDRVSARPDILAAQARVQAARAAVQEQRARRWEDVGVGAIYARDRVLDDPEPIEDFNVAGFRVSIPLPLWDNKAGRIHEAEAAAERAEKEVAATKLNAESEASAARAAMRIYAQLVAEHDDKILPAATRIEAQLNDSYSEGQTSLTEVLRARTRRLELQRQRLDALRDYHLARIRHSAATADFSRAEGHPGK